MIAKNRHILISLQTFWRSLSTNQRWLINETWHRWIIRKGFNPPDRSTLKPLALIIKVCVFLRGNVLENILSCLFRKSICTSIGRGLTSAASSNKYQRDVIQHWNNCSWQKHRGQRQVNRRSAAKRKALGQKRPLKRMAKRQIWFGEANRFAQTLNTTLYGRATHGLYTVHVHRKEAFRCAFTASSYQFFSYSQINFY